MSVTSVASISREADKEVDEELKENQKRKMHKANMKRYFFTLVANAQKAIGPKNLACYINTNYLFSEVVKLGKSVDDWPNFIMNELKNNPKEWIDEDKIEKLEKR